MALSTTLKVGIGAVVGIAVLLIAALTFLGIQLIGSASDIATSVSPETIGGWIDQLLKLVSLGD